jgi:hypothetical protein
MKFIIILFLAVGASAIPLTEFRPTIPSTNTCGREQNIGLGPIIQDFFAM